LNDMTIKERWQAVLRGEQTDHLPFWSKIDPPYIDSQSEAFRNMSFMEMHQYFQDDPMIYLPGYIYNAKSRMEVRVNPEKTVKTAVFFTDYGNLTMELHYDAPSQSWYPIKHPVTTVEEIKLMTEWYSHSEWKLAKDRYEQVKQMHDSWGQNAITAIGVGASELMHWVQWLCSVEDAHYLLADYPDEVEELFAVAHRRMTRALELYLEYKVGDIYLFSENTSTTLISPTQYRNYCLPVLNDYADIVNASGNTMMVHMCGLLHNLLEDLKELRCSAFEAFTSPPVGDTRLADGKKICPGKALIGGTNAALWTKSAKEIIAEIERDLAALADCRGIVISPAGLMTPLCKPETVKEVCEFVKGFKI